MTMRTTFWHLDASFNFMLSDIDLGAVLEGTFLARPESEPTVQTHRANVRLVETCVLHILGFSIMETAAHCVAQGLGGTSLLMFHTYNVLDGLKTAVALASKWLGGQGFKIHLVRISGRDLTWLRAFAHRRFPLYPRDFARIITYPEFQEPLLDCLMFTGSTKAAWDHPRRTTAPLATAGKCGFGLTQRPPLVRWA